MSKSTPAVFPQLAQSLQIDRPCTKWYNRSPHPPRRSCVPRGTGVAVNLRRGLGYGHCRCRGATASQVVALVGRVHDCAVQPWIPPRIVAGRVWGPRRHGGYGAVGDLRRRLADERLGLLGAGDDVPRPVGRDLPVRERGLAQVHDACRSTGHVRLLDRLVGRARDLRQPHRLADPGAVVLQHQLGRVRRRRPPEPLQLHRDRMHRRWCGCSTSSASGCSRGSPTSPAC